MAGLLNAKVIKPVLRKSGFLLYRGCTAFVQGLGVHGWALIQRDILYAATGNVI